MPAVAQTTLSSLIMPELSVRQLGERLASEARVYCAVTDWTGLSREQGLALVCAETTAPEGIEVVETFGDHRHEGLVIQGRIQGEPTAQILFATSDEKGRIVELKSYFKYMHPFTLIRENVRKQQPGFPADAWAVQPLPPDTGEFHESPQSFPWSPDLAFHSPVMRVPFTPRPVAAEILGHAHSVYGVRKWSDLVLANGNRRMGWFDADIKRLVIEMAVLLTFEGEQVTELNAFARPWNASLALYSRVITRLGERLAPEYSWGDEQPAYESYL